MTPADIIEVIAAGMCHDGEKRDECATCQRKLLAIEAVRRMGAVVEAADSLVCEPTSAVRLGALENALDALDGGDSNG